jgi:hypothetical protein
MFSLLTGRGLGLFLIAALTIFAPVPLAWAAKASGKSKARPSKPSSKRGATAAAACNSCGGAAAAKNARSSRRRAKSIAVPCQPKGFIDPRVSHRLDAAMRDLRRAGIKPQITSAWRSSDHQARLHRCSNSKRCRRSHPGLYYALPAGSSMHEAGFAVDVSGIAKGPRGAKTLTPDGRRIISVMRRHGFNWRYGLADPAHFEADPTKHGYSTVKQAITRNQTRCTVRAASRAKPSQKPKRGKNNLAPVRAASELKPYLHKRRPAKAAAASRRGQSARR